MSTSNTPFTEIYTQWLQSFNTLFSTGVPPVPAEAANDAQREHHLAQLEWEDEGGAIRPDPKKPELAVVRKLPL